MTRFCTACQSERRQELDLALLAHSASYRRIAAQFGLSEASLRRHEQTHLRQAMEQSKEWRMLANSESLIAEMNRLHEYVDGVLQRGVTNNDDRLILMAVREGRANVDSVAKIAGIGGDLAPQLLELRDQFDQLRTRHATPPAAPVPPSEPEDNYDA